MAEDLSFAELRAFAYDLSERTVLVKEKRRRYLCLNQFHRGTLQSVYFPFARWNYLVGFASHSINVAIRNKKTEVIHIGGCLHASVKPQLSLVKLEYLKEGLKKRFKKGVTLNLKEWTKLMELMETVVKDLCIDDIPPCFAQDDHQNQEGAYRCIECYPYGYKQDP